MKNNKWRSDFILAHFSFYIFYFSFSMIHYSQHQLKVAATEPEHVMRKAEFDNTVRLLEERLALLEQMPIGRMGGPVVTPQLATPVITATQTTSGPQTASLSLEWLEVPETDRYLVQWAPPGGDLWNELAIVNETYYSYSNYLNGIPLSYKFRIFAISDLGITKSNPSEEVLLTSPSHISLRLTKLDSHTVEIEFNGGNLGAATQVQLYYRYEGDLGKKFQRIYSGLATSYQHTQAKSSTNRSLPYKNIYFIKIRYPNVGLNTSYAVSEELGIDTY